MFLSLYACDSESSSGGGGAAGMEEGGREINTDAEMMLPPVRTQAWAAWGAKVA